MRIIIKNDSVNKYLAGEDKKPKTIIKEKKKVSTKSKIKPEIKKKTSSTKNNN
jgi:hypothetical protein